MKTTEAYIVWSNDMYNIFDGEIFQTEEEAKQVMEKALDIEVKSWFKKFGYAPKDKIKLTQKEQRENIRKTLVNKFEVLTVQGLINKQNEQAEADYYLLSDEL